MGDVDRIIGSLEEFKRHQIAANSLNQTEHQDMMKAIKEMNQWRWKLDGMKILVVAVCGILGGAFAKAAFSWVLGS